MMSLVCREWRSVCDTEVFWRKLFTTSFGSPLVFCGTWKEKVKYVGARYRSRTADFPAVCWSTALGLLRPAKFPHYPADKDINNFTSIAAYAGDRIHALLYDPDQVFVLVLSFTSNRRRTTNSPPYQAKHT